MLCLSSTVTLLMVNCTTGELSVGCSWSYDLRCKLGGLVAGANRALSGQNVVVELCFWQGDLPDGWCICNHGNSEE